MKKLISIMALALAFALSIPAYAEDAKPENKKTVEKVDYKDAFLSLALEKTKLYSGKVEDALGKGIDVAQKEAPELAKEWLRWRFYYHLFYTLQFPCLFAVLIGWICFCHSKSKSCPRSEWDEVIPMSLFIGFFVLSISFLVMALDGHPMKLIQITTAPRIYLIESVAELIRSR
jgi:hypothetical protein